MNRHTEHGKRGLEHFGKPLVTALILGALVTAAIVYASASEETWEYLKNFERYFLLLCISAVVIAWFCNGLRLKLLARGLGYKLSLLRTTQVTLAGEFGVGATPGGSGMLAIRLYLMRKLGVPAGTTLSMLTVDGIMDMVFFAVLIG